MASPLFDFCTFSIFRIPGSYKGLLWSLFLRHRDAGYFVEQKLCGDRPFLHPYKRTCSQVHLHQQPSLWQSPLGFFRPQSPLQSYFRRKMSQIYIYADSDLPASPGLSDLLEDMERHLRRREKYICTSTDPTWDSYAQPSYQLLKSSRTMEISAHLPPPSGKQNPTFLAIGKHDTDINAPSGCDVGLSDQGDQNNVSNPLTSDLNTT